VLADVQKSPARKGESSKFDCQSPESRASLFFPYNLSANVRRRAPRVLAGAQRHDVNTGRKLTPFHRSKTDPPSRVTDRAA
jgi:hypothetical protein